MYRSMSLILLAGGLVLLSAVSVHAQDAVLGQMYGNGVHAYFSRDYVKAHEHLTAAVDGGAGDPRCYYFRGLAYLKLGRETEASMDFEKGAKLESRDVNRFYNVGRSLERVQGRQRLLLEQHRVKARMAALQRAEDIRKVRYEQIREQQSRTLQEQAEAAPEAPAKLPAEPAAKPTADDPFAVGPLDEPAEKPTEETAKPAEELAEPAEEPTEKLLEEPAADPFAVPGEEPAEKPAEEPPAEEPPAEKPDDGDNPFQDEPATDKKPAAEEEPTADEEPAIEEKQAADEEPATEDEAAVPKPPAKKADVDPADPFAQ